MAAHQSGITPKVVSVLRGVSMSRDRANNGAAELRLLRELKEKRTEIDNAMKRLRRSLVERGYDLSIVDQVIRESEDTRYPPHERDIIAENYRRQLTRSSAA